MTTAESYAFLGAVLAAGAVIGAAIAFGLSGRAGQMRLERHG